MYSPNNLPIVAAIARRPNAMAQSQIDRSERDQSQKAVGKIETIRAPEPNSHPQALMCRSNRVCHSAFSFADSLEFASVTAAGIGPCKMWRISSAPEITFATLKSCSIDTSPFQQQVECQLRHTNQRSEAGNYICLPRDHIFVSYSWFKYTCRNGTNERSPLGRRLT